MPFAIKQNKRIKFKGVWEHYDSRHFIRPPHTWEKHCPQWFKKNKNLKGKKDEEEEGGGGGW